MPFDLIIQNITLALGEARYRQKASQGIVASYHYFGVATMLTDSIQELKRLEGDKHTTESIIGHFKAKLCSIEGIQQRGEKNKAYSRGKVEGLRICIDLLEKLSK